MNTQEQANAPSNHKSSLRLLILDSNEVTQKVVSFLLENAGFGVTKVTTCAAARLAIETFKPEVLLLAITLLDGDGLQFLLEVKGSHPTLPVVILTSQGDNEILVQKAFQNGASGYVSKELPIDEVIVAIHRAVKQSFLNPRVYHSEPDDLSIYLHWAKAAKEQGLFEQACRILSRAQTHFSLDAGIQYQLACCNALMGKYELGTEFLQRALEIAPRLEKLAREEPDLKEIWSRSSEDVLLHHKSE